MKHFLLAIFLFFTWNSCKNQCSDTANIIQTFIDIPKLDNVFFPQIEGRVPLYLLNNKYVDQDINLKKYGQKVLIVDDTTDTNGNYIEIVKLDKKQNKIDIAFYYKKENIEVSGVIRPYEGKCKIKDFELIFF